MVKCLPEFEHFFTVFLKNRNFISKIKSSNVTDYAAVKESFVQLCNTFKVPKSISCTAHLTLNAQMATKVVCFSRLLKCLKSLYGKQCGPTLFASILNSSVMVGNYLQQTTSADEIFRCMFFLAL